jgi:hypothetical protein
MIEIESCWLTDTVLLLIILALMIPLLNNPFRLNQISIGEHPYGTRSRDRIQDRKEERTQGGAHSKIW